MAERSLDVARYRVILASQWHWSRLVIVLGTVAGFGIPVLSVQGASRTNAAPADELLRFLDTWSMLYPLLAGTLGLLVSLAAWAPDHRNRHVHALALPIPRWRYVLLRFLAGVTVLLLPMAAVQVGAFVAASTAVVPTGLQTYPWALGLRFALATLVAFAMFFAISGGTTRTAGLVLLTLLLVALVQVGFSIAGARFDFVGAVTQVVFDWPGPMAIFAGRWMLIDV